MASCSGPADTHFALFVLCTRYHDEVRLPHDVTFATSDSRPGAVLSVTGPEFHVLVYFLYFQTNVNQQNMHFLYECFKLIIVPSTCFDHPSVYPQEDLYMNVKVVLRMNTWLLETCRRHYK